MIPRHKKSDENERRNDRDPSHQMLHRTRQPIGNQGQGREQACFRVFDFRAFIRWPRVHQSGAYVSHFLYRTNVLVSHFGIRRYRLLQRPLIRFSRSAFKLLGDQLMDLVKTE